MESQQSNRPVGCGKGMSDIPAQCGNVADLRSGDEVAGFGQCLGMRADQRIQNNAIDRDGGAYKEFVPSHFEGCQLGDGSHVQ